jgi:hypothetical protein
MKSNSTYHIFVSFWAVCLDNLPPGAFRHRVISPGDAKRIIDQAREHHALLCLSDDDLLAPYRKHERDNHEALCRILKKDWDIDLSLKDFCSNSGGDDHPLYAVNPLSCMQVRDADRLLIVTCNYTLSENAKATAFEVAPDSIAFHLIEAIPTGEPPPAGDARPDLLLGSMQEDAELLDQMVADAMRQRQIQAWHPSQEDFTALEAIAEATGRTVQDVLNDAVHHFLKHRDRT